MVCNYIAGYIISKSQRKALDTDCDPERFLKMMDRQEKRFRRNDGALNRLAVNRAAAHMVLGDYKRAEEYLEGIDTSYLSEKNGTYLVYIINLIFCYYELGRIDEAELLYETKMVKLCPIGKRLQKSVDLLVGERYYFLKQYDLSYDYLYKLLNFELNKRQYMEVLYYLAQMDMIKGETKQAIDKLSKVAKQGNKLWIAKASRDKLDHMQMGTSKVI
jgi:tetratricopeptide (TPR) repeat protein